MNKSQNCTSLLGLIMCLINRLANKEEVINIKANFGDSKIIFVVTWLEEEKNASN